MKMDKEYNEVKKNTVVKGIISEVFTIYVKCVALIFTIVGIVKAIVDDYIVFNFSVLEGFLGGVILSIVIFIWRLCGPVIGFKSVL